MKCSLDLEVMSSNPDRAKLGVRSTCVALDPKIKTWPRKLKCMPHGGIEPRYRAHVSTGGLTSLCKIVGWQI